MFDVDRLLVDLQGAAAEDEPRLAVRDVLRRALEQAPAMAEAFAPTEGGITYLHQSDQVSVLNVVWAPGMVIFPHDHRMWAAIGIYTGREDNTFFRRDGKGLVESGGKQLDVRDVAILGDDTIHQVANSGRTLTGAIHVYGGDFANQPRSQWGPGHPLEERPYDLGEAQRLFAEANAAWRAAG